MNVRPDFRQASIGFLIFQYYHSITPTVDQPRETTSILDLWEYINRRLVNTSVSEVEKALDELEKVGIIRNGSLASPESLDPHNKSKKKPSFIG